jgi:hypothetical protein
MKWKNRVGGGGGRQIKSLTGVGEFNVSKQQNAEGCPTFGWSSFGSIDKVWFRVSAQYDVNKLEPYSVDEISSNFC